MLNIINFKNVVFMEQSSFPPWSCILTRTWLTPVVTASRVEEDGWMSQLLLCAEHAVKHIAEGGVLQQLKEELRRFCNRVPHILSIYIVTFVLKKIISESEKYPSIPFIVPYCVK